MKRFEKAQIGDLVYDDVFGDGEIKSIDESKLFSVTARFKNITQTYTNEGHFSVYSIKPTLFYRQGEQRNLTQRPGPEIDWSKVPSGVKVKVAGNSYGIFMAYLPHLEFPFWVFDEDSVGNAWGYYGCELAEECKPEWIKK